MRLIAQMGSCQAWQYLDWLLIVLEISGWVFRQARKAEKMVIEVVGS